MTWERDSWKRFANCRDADPLIFFTVGDTGEYGDEVLAKRYCADCPVRKACRRLVNEGTNEKGGWPGIYGGTNHSERRREEGGKRRGAPKKIRHSTDLLPWPIPDIVAS